MPKATAIPGIQLGSHDIVLWDGTRATGVEAVAGPAGIAEDPIEPSTLIVNNAGNRYGSFGMKFAHEEQRTWEGGRGILDFLEDNTRFADSKELWSLTPGKLAPAPRWQFGTGVMVGDINLAEYDPTDGRGWSQSTISLGHAWPFTTTSAYTVDKIGLWYRRSDAPMANDITVSLYTDDGGEPSDVPGSGEMTSGTISKGDLTTSWQYFDVDLAAPQSLSDATKYWIVVTGEIVTGSGIPYIGVDSSSDTGKYYTSGNWVGFTSGSLYYRAVALDANKLHRFTLMGAEYIVTEPEDGSAAQVYMQGERGEATSGSTTTMVDTAKGMSGAWVADQWNGWRIKFISGAGVTQDHLITDTATDGTITYVATGLATASGTQYVIYGGPAWQEVLTGAAHDTAIGLTVVAKDVIVSKDVAYIAQGTGINTWRLRWDADNHEYDAADHGVSASRLLAMIEDGTEVIYRAYNGGGTNYTEVKKSDAVEWGTGWTFGDIIETGDWGFDINKLIEHDGKCYVLREDGAGYILNDKFYPVKVNLGDMPFSTNGIAAVSQNYNLFFNFAFSMERLYQGTVDDIGPWLNQGLPDNRRGYVSAIASYLSFLFLAIDRSGEGDGYSSVLMYNGMGYHEIFRGWSGARIRNVWLQGILDGNPLLWINIDGELAYIKLPKYSLDPLKEIGFEVQPEGILISATHDFAYKTLPSYIKSIIIHSKNLNAGTYIAVDYQYNENADTDNWLSADAVHTSPAEVDIRIGNCFAFRYRLRLITDDADNIPIVDAIAVKAFSRAPLSYQWTVPAITSSDSQDGDNYADLDPDTLYARLIDYADNAEVVYVRSRLPRMDKKFMIILPTSIRRKWVRDGVDGHEESAQLIFTLMER